nr:hypothetical protein [Tanacetum cinerariifolium]
MRRSYRTWYPSKILSYQERIGAAGGSKLEPSKSKINFRPLFSKNLCEGAKISIPRKVVETIGTRFANTFYGFLCCPIILKTWSMKTRLCKKELTRISVWVKIHDVPIQVFSKDGLSIIASQIDKPIMLDFYTTSMCIDSWGRSSFARCLTEINAKDALTESLTIGVPLIEGSGYNIETVTLEYEWKPPRCDQCKIFGHVHDHCPKKKKGKSKSTTGGQFVGLAVKQNVRYEPKPTTSAPIKGATNVDTASKSPPMLKTTGTSSKKGNIITSNSYSALDDESDEDVENVYDE